MKDRATISTFAFMKRFPSEREARTYIETCRWHGTPMCPKCGAVTRIQTRQIEGCYRCLSCKSDFTVRNGTIFERSHVPLNKWLHAIYLLVTTRHSISARQLSKEIGVTRRTAGFMLTRLRKACGNGDDALLSRIIEADGNFLGGNEANMHVSKKQHAGRGPVNKTPVLGVVERGGRTNAMDVEKIGTNTTKGNIEDQVTVALDLYPDEHATYGSVTGLNHPIVNQTTKQFADGMDHTMPSEPPFCAVIQRLQGDTRSAARRFRFVDLFAGIGGIRLGFEAYGGDCVFTSEWNDFSKQTYINNFGDYHRFVGDIVTVPAEVVPDHDVLLGGFPCQPFSIAGVSKNNSLGRPHGFQNTTQGTLFFDVARIIAAKRPAAFLLENVKNLISHDKGNTFKVILNTLRDELGYEVHYKVIDGQHFTPQHRERIVIVGFRENTGFSWDALRLPAHGPKLASILHKTDGTEPVLSWDSDRFFDHKRCDVQPKYTLTPKLWAYLQAYADKHRSAGNGFGFGMAFPDSVARTLSARYYKDGSEILINQGALSPRRLTPRECARLMGFPDTFRIPVSDTQAYRQFGNSVVIPVIEEVARIMAPHIQAIIAQERVVPLRGLPLLA